MFEKIRDMLALQLEIEKSRITHETDIIDELGADSLDIVELLTSLEDELGIVITDEAAHGLRTVGDVAAFIEKII